MLKRSFVSLFLILSLYSSSLFAVTSYFQTIFQVDTEDNFKYLENDRFNRDIYEGVGAYIWVDVVHDLTPGDGWLWEFYKIEDDKGNPVNQLLADHAITYLGEVGECRHKYSTGFCGLLGDSKVWWNWACIPEGKYKIEVSYNGSLLGGGKFIPTPFKPTINYVNFSNQSISPINVGSPYAIEATFISSAVIGVAGKDNQCNVPLPDVTIRYTNTIKPLSGNHVILQKMMN